MFAAVAVFAAEEPVPDVSADVLAKIKTTQGKDLPLKPEEILELKSTVTNKKSTVILKAGSYFIKLSDKEKKNFIRKKVGLFKICIDVAEQEEGQAKPNKKILSGRANLLVLDLENSKVILQTTEPLARLCPT